MASSTDIAVRIVLSAHGGEAVIAKLTGISQAAIRSSTNITHAFVGAGVAAAGLAIGLGVASVKASGDFQNAMLQNVAHAGLAKDQFNLVSQSVLDMAGQVGQMPTDLAKALYPILSSLSGITDQSAKTQVALAELSDASKSVAGSTTSVTSAASAASAAFNAYNMGTNNTSQNISRMHNLFDVMNATVSAGNMQWDTYSRMIGKLSVASHAAGVSFNEENAALATLTNSGYSAQNAGTNLANLFTQLDLKTDSLAKNAKKLGITFDEQKFKSMDLAHQIEYINKATDGNQSSILKLLNNNSTAFKTFEALSGSLKNYKGNLDSLNHSQGTTAQSFQTASSGFNFAMQKLQASGQSFLITVGAQLLPIITKLVTNLAPVVTKVGDWLVKSGALKNALQFLVGTITNLVNTGTNVVNFFQHNHTAVVALQAGVFILAGAILGAMVPALIAMAIAGWMAIVPLLPFIAIGALIGLVIFGIVMAVMHWGQIAHWLQGIWGAFVGWLQGIWGRFSGWFMGILHSVGQFFVNIWNGAVSGVRAAWNFIVSIVRAGAAFLLAVITAPFRAIGQLFVWLYQHNRYFAMLIDAIRAIVSAGLAWLQAAWSAAVTFVVGLWNAISKYASQLWSMVTAAIQVEVNTAWQFLVSIWTTASSWLSDRWNQFSTFARNAWQAVSNVFSSIWGTYIAGPMQSLWNQFSNWFNNLKNQAVTFGQNIIQGFIDGINNMAGAAGQAAQNIIKNVASFLGFHSPAEKGPGAELDIWGPNLVKGFSQGMLKALPTLDAAVNITANRLSPLAAPAPRATGTSQPQGRGAVVVNHYHTYQINTMARTKAEVTRLVDMINEEQGKRVRSQYAGYSSGGIF